MNEQDVVFELDCGDGRRVPLGPTTLSRLVAAFDENLGIQMLAATVSMQSDLQEEYIARLNEMPREGARPLRTVVLDYLTTGRWGNQSERGAGVMDLGGIVEETSRDEYGVEGQSFFELLEWGGPGGTIDGSGEYGFVSLATAMTLIAEATDIAVTQKLITPERKYEIMRDVAERFKGRNGDTSRPDETGIMIRIRDDRHDTSDQGPPLFWELPWFARARDVAKPAPARPALLILDGYQGPRYFGASDNWPLRMVDEAMRATLQSITGG